MQAIKLSEDVWEDVWRARALVGILQSNLKYQIGEVFVHDPVERKLVRESLYFLSEGRVREQDSEVPDRYRSISHYEHGSLTPTWAGLREWIFLDDLKKILYDVERYNLYTEFYRKELSQREIRQFIVFPFIYNQIVVRLMNKVGGEEKETRLSEEAVLSKSKEEAVFVKSVLRFRYNISAKQGEIEELLSEFLGINGIQAVSIGLKIRIAIAALVKNRDILITGKGAPEEVISILSRYRGISVSQDEPSEDNGKTVVHIPSLIEIKERYGKIRFQEELNRQLARERAKLIRQGLLPSNAPIEATLDEEVAKDFAEYSWPGGLEQLRTVLQVMVTLAGTESTLRFSHIPQGTLKDQIIEASQDRKAFLKKADSEGMTLRDCEESFMKIVVDECKGNYTEAAKKLGISRQTLVNRLRRGSR